MFPQIETPPADPSRITKGWVAPKLPEFKPELKVGAELPASEWVVADDAGVVPTSPACPCPALSGCTDCPQTSHLLHIVSFIPDHFLPLCPVDKERLVLPKPETSCLSPHCCWCR